MARNNDKVLIPRFLDMTAARELNNYVYNCTRCFLFLTFPEENLLSPIPSVAGGSNYSYNVLNLFKMYNDYGHYFFWFFLQKSQIPQIHMLDDPEKEEEIETLLKDQPRVKEHYTFIAKNARHVLAHGIFQQHSLLVPYSDPKLTVLENIFRDKLSDKSWPENDKDWKKINRWLVQEADFTYEWIKKWANIWTYCQGGIENLQRSFYYGRWEYSKNRDNCISTDEEAVIILKYEDTSYMVYDERDKNPLSSFARAFPFQLVSDAKEYLAAAVSDCVRSQYEENGFWRSDKPDNNLKALYRNINFDGIENVRNKLYHPRRSTSVCPDAYRLYLEGLTGKMITLPVINRRPNRSSRFRR